MTLTRRRLSAGLLAAPFLGPAARAQARPMRFIVPFPAGGATDVVARVLAEAIQPRLGAPVVVENRTGSGGNIGMEAAARGGTDGQVMVMGTTGTLTINQFLYASMPYDVARDFAPVSMAFTTDHVLITGNKLPIRTAQELIALAKAEPGKLSFGSAGTGSSTHMVAELFRMVAGLDLQHVPYRGSAPALNDTVAGTVQLMLDQLPSAIGQIQGGQVRALATTGPRRARLLPEVPTMAEIGLPQAEAASWGAVLVPAGTPEPLVARLGAALREALANAGVQERLAAAGADAKSSTAPELAEFIRSETTKWGAVVKEARISPS